MKGKLAIRWLNDLRRQSAFFKLSAAARGVLLTFAYFADDQGLLRVGDRALTVTEMAEEYGLSPKTAETNVAKLLKLGVMERVGDALKLVNYGLPAEKYPRNVKTDRCQERTYVKKTRISPVPPVVIYSNPLGESNSEDEKRKNSLVSLEEKVAARIVALPKIGGITKNPAETAEAICTNYDSYGDDWIEGVMQEVHDWCLSKKGLGVLNNKRDGHRFLLGWYKRAKQWYNPRKKFNPGKKGEYDELGF